jgi:thiol-disulfide isomerase/thioredoxin
LIRTISISIALAAVLTGGVERHTIDGALFRPFSPSGVANLLVFVTTDCPVSNGYAPEIERLCSVYAARGVRCTLVYEDVDADPAAVRAHLTAYRYSGMPAAIDADASLAAQAGATLTPEAALIDARGSVRYLGRIDNQYVSLGHPRRVVTLHDLQDALDAVLEGALVKTPRTTPVGCIIAGPELRRR